MEQHLDCPSSRWCIFITQFPHMERHMIIRKWQVLRFLGVSEISIWGNILTNKTLSHYHPVCIFLLSFIPLLGISHLHSTHNHPTPPPTLNITISEKLTFRFLRKLAYFILFFFVYYPTSIHLSSRYLTTQRYTPTYSSTSIPHLSIFPSTPGYTLNIYRCLAYKVAQHHLGAVKLKQ